MKEVKDTELHIRVTEEEKKLFSEMAEKEGMSLSKYLRTTLCQKVESDNGDIKEYNTSKRGRKPIPDDQKLQHRVSIRFTEEELNALCSCANDMQVSPSALLRSVFKDFAERRSSKKR